MKVKDAKLDAPKILIASVLETFSEIFKTFFPIIEVVRKRRNMVIALAKTDIIFTMKAISSISDAKDAKKAPII